MSLYYIDGNSLTLDMIGRITADKEARVALSEEASARCCATRAQIDRWMEKDAPVVYGVNTGLGNLKDVVVPPENISNGTRPCRIRTPRVWGNICRPK